MTIDKQQEALLFTLSFDQLDRMYGGVELTALEQELFNRLKTLTEEQTSVANMLDSFGMNILTLESDIQQIKDDSDALQTDIDNLRDDLNDKDNEIIILQGEVSALQDDIRVLEREV